nr:hypothetical protein [Rhizobium setariae]
MNTNVHGLDARDISISPDGNSFAINFQGASFGQRSHITLSVEFELNEISGKSGNDLLKGAVSDDRISGGRGADKLYGDVGQDIFVFRTGDSGSTRASADTIFDFSRKQGDKIDLSGWDADSTTKGLQDFDFIGKAAFSKEAGELRYETVRGDNYLYGDTDGDGKADFLIRLDPATNLKAGDFLF